MIDNGSPAGYWGLLRDNRSFRRLWYAQIASELGDWLDLIALYALLQRLTGSGEALGALVVAQFLPGAIVGPFAGVIVDRLSRKQVMIAADLCRAVLVLLFLFVHDPSQVWIIYAVMFLKESLTSIFEPAREAVLPYLVSREELVPANAIAGLTWSVMLAGGAALGGLVSGLLGTDAAFVLDSASFLVSAGLLASIPIQETHLEGRKEAGSLQEFREGIGYLVGQRDVALYALSKALWSITGGGILVVIPLLGKEFPYGEDGALSIGLLFAARGLGAGIGPVLAQRLGGTSTTFLRRMIGPGFFLMALGYIGVSQSPFLGPAALAIVVAHTGASIQWVFSTTLLQLGVPHRLQGRIFAIELALFTLATAISSYATGLAKDAGWSPQYLALSLGLLALLPALAMTGLLWPERVEDRLTERLEG